MADTALKLGDLEMYEVLIDLIINLEKEAEA